MSPRVLRKMIYAGNRAASFGEARDALAELAEVSISAERIRRACGHVGHDLIVQQQQLQQAYQRKPLPEQALGKPADRKAPEIACVMADGGRYQLLDRVRREATSDDATHGVKKSGSARKGKHWKESRVALLATMIGPQHDTDPQPELPQALRYAAVAEKLADIGKTGAQLGDSDEQDGHSASGLAENSTPETAGQGKFERESAPVLDVVPESSARSDTSAVTRKLAARELAASQVDTHGVIGPTRQERSVVASRCNWQEFGPLVASQAWYHGFAAANRKVFVSDGSKAIEKLQQEHFSHYTSVLDLLHALSYALAAARAICRDETATEQMYDGWAARVWSGRVADVIAELTTHAERLGEPSSDGQGNDTDPRAVIRRSRVFFENHQSRMDYPKYRQMGLPLTSSLMESTVKQISRRVKGTEKFWSSPGAEAMLRLRIASLSEDKPLDRYFERRSRHAQGTRAYRQKCLALNA